LVNSFEFFVDFFKSLIKTILFL